jgi:polysaccharide pyruvyl transferase WcaK-like protein
MAVQRAFVMASADYGNIGDALIYRRALSLVDVPDRHLFVGRGTTMWLDQLGIAAPPDEVYGTNVGRAPGRVRSLAKWSTALVFGSGSTALVFDTGETPLTSKHLPRELYYLFLTAIVRARGGVVIRPPHAIRRSPSRVTLAVYRGAVKLTSLTYFRNRESRELVGRGDVVPDLGFSEPFHRCSTDTERSLLAISLRGHNELPSDNWFDGVSRFAGQQGLTPVVVTQVSHDEARSREIAQRLDCEVVTWRSDDLVSMETELVEIYMRSAVVISDRMHVLVYAASCGAVPTELVSHPSLKVRTHFAEAGIEDISADAIHMTPEQVVSFLTSQAARNAEIGEKFAAARQRLEGVRRAVAACLKRSGASADNNRAREVVPS